MKFLIAASAAAMLAASMTPAQAQSANTDTTLPESMRIQQSVTEQNARDAKRLGEQNSRTAPGNVTPSTDNNRINPAAPSPQRLQVDRNAGTRGTPGAGATTPGTSGSTGAGNAGTGSTGTGVGTSGVGTPSAGTPGVGTAGAGRGGAAGSRGSSAGGSSSGGGSSGGGGGGGGGS